MKFILIIVKKELTVIFRDKMSIFLLLLPVIVLPALSIGISAISGDAHFVQNEVRISVSKHTNTIEEFVDKYSINIISDNDIYADLEQNKIDFILKEEENAVHFICNPNSFTSFFKATKYSELYDEFISTQQIDSDEKRCIIENSLGEALAVSNVLTNLILPVVVLILILQNCTAFSNDLFAGERERRTFEICMLNAQKKSYVYFGKIITLLIVQGINICFCVLSFILSGKFTESNVKFLNDDMKSIVWSAFFLILLSIEGVIISAFISLVSSNMKSAQIGNELFSAIPIVFTIAITFGTIKESAVIRFVPYCNALSIFTSAYNENIDLKNILIVIFSNIIFIILSILTSIKVIKSDKIYS